MISKRGQRILAGGGGVKTDGKDCCRKLDKRTVLCHTVMTLSSRLSVPDERGSALFFENRDELT
jgi:hypothetical protein